jgi:UPF0755 protein
MKLVRWGIGWSLLFLVAGVIWFASYIFAPSPVTTETVVYIPQGAGVRDINTLLANQGLINDDIRFLALARLSGTSGRLRAGEYLIPPQLKPLQILQLLEKGEVIRHQVTIPEGMTVRQIAAILEQGNWIDPQRFIELTRNQEFIQALGFNLDSLEGYLFPDTYSLTRGEVTEESLIAMMTSRFFSVWKEVTENAPDLVRHRIVVLASIVEKETGDPSERPLISRVFLNRLEKKMRLQSDPTVIYGLADFSGNLTRQDLERESLYNTYLIPGLPPGPICNPGKESIAAVLHPADAPYFYFVSKNNGTHHFSTTLKEHNQAVRKYQKNKQSQNVQENNP